MKNASLIFLFNILISLQAYCQGDITPQKKVGGFSHPESVVLDEKRGVLFISNIGEKEPGDGFISKVSKSGEILELKWISGLEDPKGLLIDEDRLYVTDNTELVEMDIKDARVLKRIPLPGAEFLNDIAVDEKGALFISDTRRGSIYKVEPDGGITEWMNSSSLEQPNGLLVHGNKILVAAWGKEESGNVLEVDRESLEVKEITTSGLGNLDGIQKINSQSFFVSDWGSGKIYRVGMEGTVKEVFTSAKSVGDLLFLEAENKLILPMNHQNEVWWYSLD